MKMFRGAYRNRRLEVRMENEVETWTARPVATTSTRTLSHLVSLSQTLPALFVLKEDNRSFRTRIESLEAARLAANSPIPFNLYFSTYPNGGESGTSLLEIYHQYCPG